MRRAGIGGQRLGRSGRDPIPNGGGPAVPAPAVRVVTVSGMAGWQITVIAVSAALVAAVVLERARAARKAASATAVTRPVWP